MQYMSVAGKVISPDRVHVFSIVQPRLCWTRCISPIFLLGPTHLTKVHVFLTLFPRTLHYICLHCICLHHTCIHYTYLHYTCIVPAHITSAYITIPYILFAYIYAPAHLHCTSPQLISVNLVLHLLCKAVRG